MIKYEKKYFYQKKLNEAKIEDDKKQILFYEQKLIEEQINNKK